MTRLRTVKELRIAIDEARTVYAQLRFGVSEEWVKISKVAARSLVATMREDTTPEQMEMGTSDFGMIDEQWDLYLG